MAAALEGPVSYEGVEKSGETTGEPRDAVIFFGISLVLGIACRHILRGTRVPYTVALLIAGIALGSLEFGTHHDLGKIGSGIRIWANINPDLLLSVFLPALLFESSFSMEVHQIKRCLMQMLLLAGPGVVISTFFLGTTIKFTFPYGWDYKSSLLLGGLLSATDPVAVVALLKELGASKKLSTIIEGESLMNDGTAIVMYQLFYKMVLGKSFSFRDTIQFLLRVSVGAVTIGLAFGVTSVLWLGIIFNDAVIEIALTLAISYLTFCFAQDWADVSGVLAVMTLGMFFGAVARTAFKGDSQESLHHFWEMVAYIANTLIFILSGVVIAEGILNSENHFERHGSSWGYLVLLYVYVQLSRIIVVGLLYPFLCRCGYGFDWKESMILVWSGLRGAVALALSLSVKQASGLNQHLTRELGILFVFFTGGIVFLTLIINGTTTQFLLHLLGLDKLSAAKIRILNYTKYEMLNKSLAAFGVLGDDEELGPADWPTVQRYITCLSNLEAYEHPHVVRESENHLMRMSLGDMRVRLLNGVQAAYWSMLDEGRISQSTAMLLMRSVDEAMDVVSIDPLSDWKGLKSNVHFPGYYKYLQMSKLPRRLVTYFTVERLESACSVCAAFLRAHRIARRQLHEFIGNSEIASTVINESSEEGEDARKFLEDVRINFPQVIRVVKTRQVTYSILKHLSEYVQDLQKAGLIEEKEMVHLDDSVQSDFKRLRRNPPLLKMPKVNDVISAHPLLGALPADIREPLGSSTKELMKVCGTTLFREGSKPNGIWLISMGIVKWKSKSLHNKHSLHPTFSHGNTLGLYEVLLGKPYMCDMITDSLVHCFFFESDKILSLVRSDPNIEGFLWQESSLSISKILLPQIFEKLSMQELRTLVAERSSMNIYLRGETIVVQLNSVGLLLEGFVRNDGALQEFITPPAALFPSHSNLSMVCLGSTGLKDTSFCHSSTCYHVETRARVIFFDLEAVEFENYLQKRTVSRLSQTSEPTRPFSRRHEGLMSWPENFLKRASSNATNDPQRSLSARAMELSMYGSLMNNVRGHFRSFRGSSGSRQCHSSSYPRVSTKEQGLLSVQSEGGGMTRKLDSSHLPRLPAMPRLSVRRRARNVERDDSTDDSDNEVVVLIDSPSMLSFSNAA
ncbi:Sodium/hydrogen exchanger 7 [Platanthera guangdongensis]|uniref:Sodium/hydrogen exchanger 7 n=1 Tax=Platanthera guangdongensis TaxID=2320717 RepID=A0ABR2LJJ2_9ASPA